MACQCRSTSKGTVCLGSRLDDYQVYKRSLLCATVISMARPLRIEFSGALYHITSRGDRREEIYEDDTDREAFLEILGQVIENWNWLCHAYCLMKT